jgi:hypothetical protein
MLKELVRRWTIASRNTQTLADEITEISWQLLKEYHPQFTANFWDKLQHLP